jgi:hypothetical protein
VVLSQSLGKTEPHHGANGYMLQLKFHLSPPWEMGGVSGSRAQVLNVERAAPIDIVAGSIEALMCVR